jgi:hypothetical protein
VSAWVAVACARCGAVRAANSPRGRINSSCHGIGSTKGQLRAEAERQRRHAPWVAINEAVHTLQAQGTPITIIARQLGISCPTSDAYLR